MEDWHFVLIAFGVLILLIGVAAFNSTDEEKKLEANDFDENRFFREGDSRKTDVNVFIRQDDLRPFQCKNGYFMRGINNKGFFICGLDAVGAGASTFTGLNDTPASYSGFALQCVIVNSDENGLTYANCTAGGAGRTYTGILPIVIDNDTNTIGLDINAYSDWVGLFDGFDSNEFILWVDGNETFYKIADINALFGDNINRMLFDVGAAHFGDITVTGLALTGNVNIQGGVISIHSPFLSDISVNNDNQRDIGTPSKRWKKFFVMDINAANDVNASRFCLFGVCVDNWTDFVSDSNAQTACEDNEVLMGDGTCAIYIESETFLPETILTISGTDTNNNDINAIIFYDLNSYSTQEAAGANPLQVDINFVDVDDFDSISMREKYIGGSGHEILLELYNFDVGVWEEYFEMTDQGGFVVSNISVYDANQHILDGNVHLRLRHIQTGIPSHELFIDFFWLIKGTTTSVNSEHDALSGRDSNSNHPNLLLKEDLNKFNSIAWSAVSKTDSNISDLAARDFSDLTNRLFSLLNLDDVTGLDSFFVNESDYFFDDKNASTQDLNLNKHNLIEVNDGNFVDVNASGIIRSNSVNGYSEMDGNVHRLGSDPNNRICIEITPDMNATFGFCP